MHVGQTCFRIPGENNAVSHVLVSMSVSSVM